MFCNCLSLHLFYTFGQSSPIIKGCFSFMHMMKLCLKLCSSMSMIKGTIPIGPEAVQLAMLTHSVFFVISTLSDIFVKRWYEIQEHVAPV